MRGQEKAILGLFAPGSSTSTIPMRGQELPRTEMAAAPSGAGSTIPMRGQKAIIIEVNPAVQRRVNNPHEGSGDRDSRSWSPERARVNNPHEGSGESI